MFSPGAERALEGFAGNRFGGRELRFPGAVRARQRHGSRAGGRSQHGCVGFRPKDMKPIWAEVPMLYCARARTQGLVPYIKPGAWSKGDAVAPSSNGGGSVSGRK